MVAVMVVRARGGVWGGGTAPLARRRRVLKGGVNGVGGCEWMGVQEGCWCGRVPHMFRSIPRRAVGWGPQSTISTWWAAARGVELGFLGGGTRI